MKKQPWRRRTEFCAQYPAELGISLVELTASLAMIGVLAALVTPALSLGGNNLKDSSARTENLLKLARARSMAQTSAYKISPLSNSELKVEYSNRCNSSTWKKARGIPEADLKLDQNVTVSTASENGVVVTDPSSDWSVCFDSRGMADKTLKLTLLNDQQNKTQQIQVFRGGNVSLM